MLAAIAFYCFAAVTVASAVMVISARNPVHSVLFLILAFFNAAGLFVLTGAEFIAMILVVVYVGAVAVLFLFVVMMLDIGFSQLREGFMQYLPIGGLIGNQTSTLEDVYIVCVEDFPNRMGIRKLFCGRRWECPHILHLWH